MKISGFTIIKNAIINDYPIVEAITSILPVVDEMIVLVGDSQDATRELVQNINSNKIKIFDSVWDQSLREGGKVLAVETDKAFHLINPESTWAFYIQADEAVHERYLPAIKEACTRYQNDRKVEGLLFRYLHFYGTYDKPWRGAESLSRRLWAPSGVCALRGPGCALTPHAGAPSLHPAASEVRPLSERAQFHQHQGTPSSEQGTVHTRPTTEALRA